MTPWPHQLCAVSAVHAAVARRVRRLALTSPTGGGKSWIMQRLITDYLDKGKRVVLYSNRRMLIDQLSKDLSEAGLFHGIRAAGHDGDRECKLQISSVQTEGRRLKNAQKKWELHKADLVLVDEGHLFANETGEAILTHHFDQGAAFVLVTATPLGLGGLATELITAGTNSELRACGALVPAITFAPDEPDLRAFKKLRAKLEAGENPTEKEALDAMMTPDIFGRLSRNFELINPFHKPTICFGPDVDKSLWIAEQFNNMGVPASHIDGERCYFNGKLERTSQKLREEILDAHRTGHTVVLCNRFVLREGLNLPWLAHGIFATIFGSIQTYLQAGGRLLRAYDGCEHVTVQDHGGNYWRHGSLNEDRVWDLQYTSAMLAGLRADRLRKDPPKQPFVCPKCQRVWTVGTTCQPLHGGCGYELGINKRSRPVVSTDGKLRQMTGDFFKPRMVARGPQWQSRWEQMYYRSLKGKGIKTFKAAEALFAYENNWFWPDRSWPFMPINDVDFYAQVPHVPMHRLIPKPIVAEVRPADQPVGMFDHEGI